MQDQITGQRQHRPNHWLAARASDKARPRYQRQRVMFGARWDVGKVQTMSDRRKLARRTSRQTAEIECQPIVQKFNPNRLLRKVLFF